MVKLVENYCLERVIGQGQFGLVYKGINQTNNQDVAVKSIKWSSLNGKFYELLENEIKVLKSCNNINIIKLYDIKKTKNNIYLITEYCNEGDLSQELKAKGKFSEEVAVEYFCQILNAFQTLTKNKIMHRDFKLPNILKHNGHIKVADFGFAKMLGNQNYAQTMLGSPLNMAPEILAGKEYTNKADIWSIAVCFHEMLFGVAPYNAKNIVELHNKIKAHPFQLPIRCGLSPEVQDVLLKMLVCDPLKRISWEKLFEHPVTKLLESWIQQGLEQAMNDQEIENISWFYLKNNRVIDHPEEINQKQDINQFAFKASKEHNQRFQGNVINRKWMREEEQQAEERYQTEQPQQDREQVVQDQEPGTQEETQREKIIKTIKQNTQRILHERNKYVFLATVAEDSIQFKLPLSDVVTFCIIKKLFVLISNLKNNLQSKNNAYGLECWQQYLQCKEYKKMTEYISDEYELFKNQYNKVSQDICNKYNNESKPNYKLVKEILRIEEAWQLDSFLKSLVKEYFYSIFSDQNNYKSCLSWQHASQILDSLRMNEVLRISEGSQKYFDFKLYYQELKHYDLSQHQQIFRKKLQETNIDLKI